jgi:hypothetical protein
VKKLFRILGSFLLLATMGCSLASMMGCGLKTESENATGSIQVQIPVREQNEPRLKVVTLNGIQDLHRVSGEFATFYYAPKIEENSVNGEVPRARFIKTVDGIFVPADSLSAEMAAVYFHLQNMAAYDTSVGLAGVNQWPRRVSLSTRIKKNDDWVRNNSFYDQKSDTIIFVDFEAQTLPLTLNSGVVAHEHFHSIFSKLVLLPLIKSGKITETLKVPTSLKAAFSALIGAPDFSAEPSASNDELRASLHDFVLFKALNEGLADYWGWIYSKDENFVSASIPGETTRGLQNPPSLFPDRGLRDQEIDSMVSIYNSAEDKPRMLEEIQDAGGRYAYRLGNEYARFFRGLMKDSGDDLSVEHQNQFVVRVLKMLQGLRENMLNSSSKDFIEPEKIIAEFGQENPSVLKSSCSKFELATGNSYGCDGAER